MTVTAPRSGALRRYAMIIGRQYSGTATAATGTTAIVTASGARVLASTAQAAATPATPPAAASHSATFQPGPGRFAGSPAGGAWPTAERIGSVAAADDSVPGDCTAAVVPSGILRRRSSTTPRA